MKKCIFVLILLFGATSIWAQPRDPSWARSYGGTGFEWFTDVQRTSDGNYILCGGTGSYGSGPRDNGWVVKINPQGDTLWTRAFDAGLSDYFMKARELGDGCFILVGVTDQWPANWSQGWLLKLSADGDSLWSRFYSYSGSAYNYARAVEPLSSGGFVFVGGSGSGSMNHHVWVVTTDSVGNVYENKLISRDNCDAAFCVKEVTDGFIAAGLTYPYHHANQGWLLKLDFNADTVWTRTYGGPYGDDFYALVRTTDSGYVLTGVSDSYADWTGLAWLMKVNANGDSLWSRSYGAPSYTGVQALLQTSDGGFALGGLKSPNFWPAVGDMYLVRTDSEGNLLWSQTFGGLNSESCNGLVEAYDGGYLLAGGTDSYGLGGDGWVVKTEPELSGGGYVTLEQGGPPNWDYRLHWASGSIQFLTFRNVCAGTHGSVLGDALAQGWTATDFGNSVVFWTSNPLTSGSLVTFRLNHPLCSDQVTWVTGDSSGATEGPATGSGFVTLEIPGPPNWNYRLHWQRGNVVWLVFSNLCPGTTGSVEGEAQIAGWTAASYSNYVEFTTTNPLTLGSLSGFVLSHPYCSGYASWTVGDSSGTIDGPLPVELISFEAVAGDQIVTLHWQTASEIDNDYFEILRNSELVARMASQGNTATGHEYTWTDEGLENGYTYAYTLIAVDLSGAREKLSVVEATPMAGLVPLEYALLQNRPNPFNANTEIEYSLRENGYVTLTIYNAVGQQVATLVDGYQTADRYQIAFDASALASGIYLYRLEVNGFTAVKKMVLMK